MTLLEDIQNAAIDGTSDLGTLLRKCKLLASRIGSKPLENWLIWEANGYPADVPVPDYRKWPLVLKGHFAGPFGSGLQNAEIPIAFLPAEGKEVLSDWECRHSVSTIETLLREAKSSSMKVTTGDLALALGMKVYRNLNCIQAWGEFSNSYMIELLNSVRNRILDFALALEKEDSSGGAPSDGTGKNIDPNRVTQIFNTTVYGTAQMVGSAYHSTVSMTVHANDLASLEGRLRESGVSDADIADLRSAVKQEPKIAPGGEFGPKVSAWIGTMLKKAAEGGWKIALGAGATLLEGAIKHYYGLK